MSITNKTRIQGLILIVVGAILMIIYKVGGDELPYREIVFGFGIGAFAGGVGSIIGTLFKKGKLEGNYEIQENDERLHQIWDKAGHSAYNFSYFIIFLMIVVVALTDIPSIMLLMFLLIIMPFLHIGFTYYYNKRL